MVVRVRRPFPFISGNKFSVNAAFIFCVVWQLQWLFNLTLRLTNYKTIHLLAILLFTRWEKIHAHPHQKNALSQKVNQHMKINN